MALPRRPILIAIGSIIVLIILAILSVPLFLNADSFRARIETALTNSLGRKVTLGKLNLSILSGSLEAQDATIADDPAFSSQPFLHASSLKINVDVIPLVFHHQLHIEGFDLDSPGITLIRAANGTWNYSTIGGAQQSTSANQQSSSLIPNLTVGHIAITNGKMTVDTQSSPGAPAIPPHTYDQLNLKVTNFAFDKSFPFTASAHVPGDGNISLNGNAGPVDPRDASVTPFTVQGTLKHIDLASSGVVPPDTGISGLADVDLKANSNGQILNADVTATAQNLQLAKNGSPSPKPVNVQLTVAQNVRALTGQIQKGTITIGKAVVNIAGTYQTSGSTTALNIQINGQSMPIDELQAFLPSVGVHLPSGSHLQGGTLTTTLAVTGSTAAPFLNGPVRVDNTSLAGFDLNSKLGPITKLTGAKSGSATSIRSFSTNIHVEGGNIRTDNLTLDVPSLGTASGAGTVSATGALNYNIVVKPTLFSGSSQPASGGGIAGQLLGAANVGGIGGVAGNALKNGVPVAIGGTTSNPTFSPNMNNLLRNGAGNAIQSLTKPSTTNSPLSNALGGLFGKHK
ncbi:hypothetical protein GCM10011507_11590 [Edaphobacter acidisoli]|uniref:AsmA domain-containing protein n=1 Tax=Edaphobacter acidisoli TaxID=2040573 RepID=A0A916RNF3_9BACT|nr:AsmA family protein [Edaphobacter acidisoli]GGA61725.1 hypothetical protein GCM10011507_11590 [Edaphobacter acidisoli]